MILALFFISCRTYKEQSAVETEIIDCESFDDFVEINALQKNDFLFNSNKQILLKAIDSVAQESFADSIQFLSNYSFQIKMDSLGNILSIEEKRDYGKFGDDIITFIKSKAPLNPPYFIEKYSHLGVFDDRVRIYIMFNNCSSDFNLNYGKAKVFPHRW